MNIKKKKTENNKKIEKKYNSEAAFKNYAQSYSSVECM